MDFYLQSLIVKSLQESIAVKQAIVDSLMEPISTAASWMIETLRNGHKLLLFGNGGSAADAQHIAAEFIGRFEKERRAWPAIALTTDTSVLTALGNDYGVETIFARQIEALGQPDDLAFAISTSGNSPNVLAGVAAAKAKGLRVIGFTGENGGQLAMLCDLALCVPSRRTARIQEGHLAILHALCEVVELGLTESR
jgi:D-sedoheptulose 7-phosphate isomerase